MVMITNNNNKKNIATVIKRWPTSCLTSASVYRCCQCNGRRLLTTVCDGHTLFSTFDNTCDVPMVELSWQQLCLTPSQTGWCINSGTYFVPETRISPETSAWRQQNPPCYRAKLVADGCVRQLCSADTWTLVVSRMRSSFGDRTFAAAGPQVWNSLPPDRRLRALFMQCSCSYWRHFYSDSGATAQC